MYEDAEDETQDCGAKPSALPWNYILWRRGLTKLSGLAHTSLELEISLPQPLEYQPVYFSFSTRGTWCLG